MIHIGQGNALEDTENLLGLNFLCNKIVENVRSVLRRICPLGTDKLILRSLGRTRRGLDRAYDAHGRCAFVFDRLEGVALVALLALDLVGELVHNFPSLLHIFDVTTFVDDLAFFGFVIRHLGGH